MDSIDISNSDNSAANNYYKLDISDDKNLSSIKNDYDAVIHCAGSPSVPMSVEKPLFDFSINLRATVNMLEFSRLNNSMFIFLSTVSIYDSENKLPLHENSTKKPTSPYGAAKLSSESYCQAYNRTYDLDTRIVRIFNTFWPGMNHLFISDMINKIKQSGDEIILRGSGNQIRDYVYIYDLIEAIYFILSYGSPGEDYNICSGEKHRLKKIVEHLINIIGKPNIKIKCDNKKYKGDIEKWYGSPKKLNKIGFNQKITLKEGLKKIIEQEKND